MLYNQIVKLINSLEEFDVQLNDLLNNLPEDQAWLAGICNPCF